MTDHSHVETTQPLPYAAEEILLGAADFDEALAMRLAEAGASDTAIDAAGGPGTAARLHAAATGQRTRDGSLAIPHPA